MFVIKRNGNPEKIAFDKITKRIDTLLKEGNIKSIDPVEISHKVISNLKSGMKTSELDDLAASITIAKFSQNIDYGDLAARISVSNLHKETVNKFSEAMKLLSNYYDNTYGEIVSLINSTMMKFIDENVDVLDKIIENKRDYNYTFFGIETLKKSYLLKINGKIIERPQYMLLRVACCIHMPDLQKIKECYDDMSNMLYTHATPTLYNSGMTNASLSSCYVVDINEDSVDGMYKTLLDCSKLSKAAGGIGLSVNKIRAYGSYIKGSNGYSKGVVPMLKVYNEFSVHIDQGGRRPGAIAIYIEMYHKDIKNVIDLKRNTGADELRARELFYALWVCDLFMKRVVANENWTLFSPNIVKGLENLYGDEFEQKYIEYEKSITSNKKEVIKARDLFNQICEVQRESGMPFMLYKDSCNKKSNQKNIGIIKSSNLCTEILLHTSPKETAVCNLASIALPKFVKLNNDTKKYDFDFNEMNKIVGRMCENLDKVIDRTYYPTSEAKFSNLNNRPMGIGVQGLADVFHLLELPYESKEARQLNAEIFENIYYSAVNKSCDLAKENGVYNTYKGSPMSEGLLQFDMHKEEFEFKQTIDWTETRKKVAEYGVRNSVLIALMPTASTSQILGNNESFEPYTNNIYIRRTQTGEFTIVNSHLVKKLMSMNLWNIDMKNKIIEYDGSIQEIKEIPDNIKDIYKTVWEMKNKTIIDMAAERGRYIDQSQSLNLFVSPEKIQRLNEIHIYGWKKGLKTGMYYLHTKAGVNPNKIVLDGSVLLKNITENIENANSKKINQHTIEISNDKKTSEGSNDLINKQQAGKLDNSTVKESNRKYDDDEFDSSGGVCKKIPGSKCLSCSS